MYTVYVKVYHSLYFHVVLYLHNIWVNGPLLFASVFFFFFFLRFDLFIFRERKEGRKRDKNISVWLPLVHPSVGTWPATQVMCPDWESNQQSFGSQAGAQSTEPYQPGLYLPHEGRRALLKWQDLASALRDIFTIQPPSINQHGLIKRKHIRGAQSLAWKLRKLSRACMLVFIRTLCFSPRRDRQARR